MHNYQFAVTYKDRKHIHMVIRTQYCNIHIFKESNLQYTVDRETIDVPSFISYSYKPIHLSIILGCSYAYYNVTHQLFDFCSLVTSHHLQGLKYPICIIAWCNRNIPQKVLIKTHFYNNCSI